MEAELPPVVSKSQLAAFTEDKSEHFSRHNLTVCTMYTVCYIGQVVFCMLMIALMHIAAQQCLSFPCGKLACGDVSCKIVSQEDCSDGVEYLYPGLICECCGACVNRSVEMGGRCSTKVFNSHVLGCVSGLCCSTERACVEKTTPFGA